MYLLSERTDPLTDAAAPLTSILRTCSVASLQAELQSRTRTDGLPALPSHLLHISTMDLGAVFSSSIQVGVVAPSSLDLSGASIVLLIISCTISSATITYRFLAPLSYVGYRKGSIIGCQRVLTPQGKSHLDLPWAKKSPCGSPRGNSYRLLTSRRSTLSFSQPISFGLVERKLS